MDACSFVPASLFICGDDAAILISEHSFDLFLLFSFHLFLTTRRQASAVVLSCFLSAANQSRSPSLHAYQRPRRCQSSEVKVFHGPKTSWTLLPSAKTHRPMLPLLKVRPKPLSKGKLPFSSINHSDLPQKARKMGVQYRPCT